MSVQKWWVGLGLDHSILGRVGSDPRPFLDATVTTIAMIRI